MYYKLDYVETALSWKVMQAAYLTVDTFFFIGGLVMAYVATTKVTNVFTVASDKAFGVYLSLSGLVNWLLLYASRWIRLTPPLMLMIWMTNNFNVAFGNGSVKRLGDTACSDNWWLQMFYVQLWFDKNGCKGEYWYLACEFWYFMIFPLCALFYTRNRASGIIFVGLMILGSMAQNGYSSYHFDKAVINTFNTGSYSSQWVHDIYDENGALNFTYRGSNQRPKKALGTYFELWARFHPYGIGILFGWLMKNLRQKDLAKTALNRCVMLSILFTGIGLCFLTWYGAALFHTPDLSDKSLINFNGLIISTRMDMAVWNAFARSLWAIGVGLIVVACDTGFGYLIKPK